MKRTLMLTLTLLMIVFTGCVSNKSFRSEQKKLQTLEAELRQNKEELVVLRKEIMQTRRNIEGTADDTDISQLNTQLLQNEQDMKSLISEQSKLTMSLKELSDSVQDSDQAIVARILALEGGLKEGHGSEEGDCACGDLNTQIARLTEDVRDARYELEIMKEAVTKGTTSTDIVSADEWAAYKKARDVYYEGRFSKAIVELDKYLANYPNSKYAGHAVYWKGESHYAMGEVQSALKEFQTVISRYPKSWKVEDAQLKIGMCYKNLGELEAARRELNKLKTNSPNYYRNDLLNRYLNELK